MKDIVFDIETGPEPDDVLVRFEPEFEPPGNLKDPEKKAAAVMEKKAAWWEKAALSPITGRVLAIGVFDGTDHTLHHGDDEKTVLEQFWRDYPAVGHPTRLIGHNIFNFDLPFLVRRSWKHGIAVPSDIRQGRYWSTRFVDTMDAWGMGTRELVSLKNLSAFLGVGEKTGSGADFAKLYTDPATREGALDYLRSDLLLTWKCWQTMRLDSGRDAATALDQPQYAPRAGEKMVGVIAECWEKIRREARQCCTANGWEYGFVVGSRSRRMDIVAQRHQLWKHLAAAGYHVADIGLACNAKPSTIRAALRRSKAKIPA